MYCCLYLSVNGSGSGFPKRGMVTGELFIYMIIEREGSFCFLNGLGKKLVSCQGVPAFHFEGGTFSDVGLVELRMKSLSLG